MAQVNIVEKKVRMGLTDAIKYQLMTHCFIKGIKLSDSDIDCLTQLALIGKAELNTFCKQMAALPEDQRIFKSAQTVRNSMNKCEDFKLIQKDGRNKKIIYLNPELEIKSKGNIFLDYKFLSVES